MYGTLDAFFHENENESYAPLLVDDTPIVRRTVPLLLVAGSVGVIAAALDVCGAPRHQPLVAALALVNVVLYTLLALVGVYSYLGAHPNACMSTLRRVVPITPETVKLGRVVSFPATERDGAHLYAVLVTLSYLDLFLPSCALIEGAVPLVLALALTHLEYWRRLWRAQRSERKGQRLVELMVERLRVSRFADVRRAAAACCGSTVAAVAGGGGGDGSSVGDHGGGGGTGSAGETGGTDGAPPAGGDDLEGGSGHSAVSVAWRGDVTDCPICMEEYAEDDVVAVLPCKHLMHKECVISWARACARTGRGRTAVATCPLCKASLNEAHEVVTEHPCAAICACACWPRRSRDGVPTMV